MKIQEAIKQGLTKLRLPHWANPDAYIELYKDEKGYGPWATLHDEWGKQALGEEEFNRIRKTLILYDNDDRWIPYEGKL